MKCDVKVCKAWCCRQFWIDLPKELNLDMVKYMELHGVIVKGRRLTIPLMCNNLTSDGKCNDYENRPGICKTWHCKNPRDSGEM